MHLHLLMLEAMFMQSDFQFLERTCYMCRKMTNSQRANILLWIKIPHSPAILLSTDTVCLFHKPVTKSEVFKSKMTMKQPFNFKQKSCFQLSFWCHFLVVNCITIKSSLLSILQLLSRLMHRFSHNFSNGEVVRISSLPSFKDLLVISGIPIRKTSRYG